MSTIKASISSTLATDLPSEVHATVIMPLLAQVNQWSTQIPILLEIPGSLHVNLIFAICKELFSGPQFCHCTLGIAISELPPPFQEFLAFITKLIELQKTEREKPLPKVHISSPSCL